jgi:hypothetical protein
MLLQELLQLIWIGANMRGMMDVHWVRIILVPLKHHERHVGVAKL